MNKSITVAVVALLVGVAVGYGGAHALAKGSASRGAGYAAAGGFRGGPMSRGGLVGGVGFIGGSVVKVDASSLTLNTRDGSSHVVLLTPSTSVSKSVAGSLADIAVGSDVIVNGSVGSDGSVTASLIQLRPASSTAPFIGR